MITFENVWSDWQYQVVVQTLIVTFSSIDFVQLLTLFLCNFIVSFQALLVVAFQ